MGQAVKKHLPSEWRKRRRNLLQQEAKFITAICLMGRRSITKRKKFSTKQVSKSFVRFCLAFGVPTLVGLRPAPPRAQEPAKAGTPNFSKCHKTFAHLLNMEENINVYQRFQPHQQLLPYIDSYWMVKTKKIDSLTYKKMPNGLTDILFIIGEDFIADNGNTRLKNGSVFFAGLKTNAVEITRQSHVDILGISMKAGAFATMALS